MKAFFVALLIILAAVVAMVAVNASRSDFLEFDRQRDAWHQRCDQYVGHSSTDPAVVQCEQELRDLIAYGTAHGWGPK